MYGYYYGWIGRVFIYPEKVDLFFDGPLISMVDALQSALTPDNHLSVFPEAMLKTLGLPNGLAVTALYEIF